jgi:poly-gamma-glutamate synthesis protein (capsule biosynthesis protein)
VPDGVVRLALAGDVMLGRGIDQVLPHPGDPALREGWVRDAGDYVELAERRSGRIPRPVDPAWPWGAALPALAAADARVLNLETSVTTSDDFWPRKAIHYRMNPANLPCLALADPDVCVLANNHVLDLGRRGLEETLDALAGAGLATAGAGRDADSAGRPAVVDLPGGARLVVVGVAVASSGVPSAWAAGERTSGVFFLPRVGPEAATRVLERVETVRRPGDLVVVSIHWGSNWGDEVEAEQVRFAHALVDGGVAVVHGHSSHHPRPIELLGGAAVLYGCGDLVNDYEGIPGYEEYRPDLRLLYVAELDAATGAVEALRLLLFRAHRLTLERGSAADARWLAAVLGRASARFRTRVEVVDGDALAAHA